MSGTTTLEKHENMAAPNGFNNVVTDRATSGGKSSGKREGSEPPVRWVGAADDSKTPDLNPPRGGWKSHFKAVL